MSVTELTIGDVAEFVNGMAFQPSHWECTGRRIIRIQNLNDSSKPYNRTTISVEEKYIVEPGDLLVSWSASLGVFTWNEPDTAVLNQHIFRVRPDLTRVNKSYFRYALDLALTRMSQFLHGSTMKHVNRNEFLGTKIPLPPLEEQRRIAAILDKADAVRRKRQSAIALTEELLRSAFLEMFGDPVTNPKGWEVKPLGSLCTIRRGGSPRPIEAYLGGSVPWIKIGDATEDNDIYIYKTAEAIKPEGVKRSLYLEPGSLIFANCGVSLGFARILKIGGCIHDGWLAFSRINESLNKIYLLKLLNSVTKHFRQIAPSGTQPNLNISIMTSFGIPVPPIQCQLEFANIVTAISLGKQRQSEAVKEADDLFNSLLQKAFRGEL